jgi:hypothetical protein
LGARDIDRILRAGFAEMQKLARLVVGKWAEECRVDDGEDRCVGADAQGEDENYDEGEAGSFEKGASGELQILREHTSPPKPRSRRCTGAAIPAVG